MYFTSLLNLIMITITGMMSFLIKFGIAYGLLNLFMFGLSKLFVGACSVLSESKTATDIVAGAIVLFVLLI